LVDAAPLALELAWAADGAVDADTVLAARVVDPPGAAADGAAADAGAVEAAPEAVVDPLIWAWMEALKVPVMPVRVNLAEKASILNWGCLGSEKLLDVNLIKYTLESGPTLGSGVQPWEPTLDTSMFVAIDWRRVCCVGLPTYRPMEDRPNWAREGAVPSSCHLIVAG